MPWAAIGLHLVALVLYPGLVLIVAVGVLAEGAASLAIDGAGLRAAPLAAVRRLREGAATAWSLLLGTALLTALAATQLAVPVNPLSSLERNLLVAAVAIAAAIWLSWGRAWSAPGARVALVIQACWLVALLSPAIVSETLRPQVLGAVTVRAQLPLKALSGLLYIVCLPALLQLVGESPLKVGESPLNAGASAAGTRVLLWLPLCGLGVSLFLPPATDDAGGSLRFVAATMGVALIAIALAATLRRPLKTDLPSLYLRLASALAGVVLVVTALTAALTSALT
jgi:hypothetical protein